MSALFASDLTSDRLRAMSLQELREWARLLTGISDTLERETVKSERAAA